MTDILHVWWGSKVRYIHKSLFTVEDLRNKLWEALGVRHREQSWPLRTKHLGVTTLKNRDRTLALGSRVSMCPSLPSIATM